MYYYKTQWCPKSDVSRVERRVFYQKIGKISLKSPNKQGQFKRFDWPIRVGGGQYERRQPSGSTVNGEFRSQTSAFSTLTY